MILPSPAALVVAHPGHELRLFRWLELDRPAVFILTDGSGRSGRSRVASTLEVLRATGSEAGSITGRFTDQEIYRLIREGDVAPIAALTAELADVLARGGFRSVVTDAFELYNPAHDLCHVVARLAVARAKAEIGLYDYAVTEASGEGITIALDDDAFERKMTIAFRYEDIAVDVQELMDRVGRDGLRREVLHRIDPHTPQPRPAAKPYYEQRGEEQVAAGKYATVLRYREHFLPFVENLRAVSV